MLIKMVDDLGAERINIVYVVAEPELTVLKGTVHFVVALEIVLQGIDKLRHCKAFILVNVFLHCCKRIYRVRNAFGENLTVTVNRTSVFVFSALLDTSLDGRRAERRREMLSKHALALI